MDKQGYTQYALLQNKYYNITLPLTTVAAFIILLIMDYFCKPDFVFDRWTAAQVQLYWEIIPVMLLTFLSGYSMGALVVLLFFTVETLGGGGLAYHCFMLIAASLLINIPIQHRWFLSLPKTLLADFMFTILLGPGWNMLLAILQGMDLELLVENCTEQYMFFSLIALPSCTLVCAICYCYHKFLPQKFKDYFFATAAASEFAAEFRKRLKSQKRPKISTKITAMIVGIAVILLISAYGIGISLFSDEINRIIHEAGKNNLFLTKNITNWLNWRTIIFATRLVVLMTIVAVPAILLAIGTINSVITNPIILMTMCLEDTAKSTENDTRNSTDSSSRTKTDIDTMDIHKLNIKNRDEIGILYNTLVNSHDMLEKYVENLEHEKKLVNDLEVAKEANKAKDLFLSNMSHEIRTPINAVLGLDEMIIRESTEDEIKNYALDIQTAGKNLLSIVNEILDFSKIEAGKMEIIPVEYDISSSINDLLNMISKRAEDKGLELKLKVNSEIPHLLEGDEIRIKQCVINILTNAVKYTEKGSVTMTVDFEKISDQKIALTFHVIDTGIGIKEEDMPKLFSAFQRIEEKRNRTIEGTGLGMSIVQQLLALMDTKLEVRSVYGEGSDFYFTVEQKVVDWEPMGNLEESYKKTQKELLQVTDFFRAPEAQVLVVDDTRLNLTVARGLLKPTQIQVDTAESGATTLKMVQQKKYDVIFLDHRMPIMDGIETLQAMRTLEGNLNSQTPCIALTANAIAGAREMYLEAGFTDYLTKPIDSAKLEKLLMNYLPKEKIIRLEEQAAEEEQCPALEKLDCIDKEAALTNCGTQEILIDAIKEFYNSIETKSASIEGFFNQSDWKNYTILVHALKSSARLIGAAALSADAARLEHCGDVAGGAVSPEKAGMTSEQAEAEIAEKTPVLLRDYRAFLEKLAPFMQVACAESTSDTEISAEEYASALTSLKECVQAFDFDTADQIIAMLGEYKVPEGEEERFRQIKEKVSAVDQAEILKLIE